MSKSSIKQRKRDLKAKATAIAKEQRRLQRVPIAKPTPQTVFVETEIGREKRMSGRFTKKHYRENYC